ncbi:hypothetical protein EQ500_01730 [Lactobacillus sp. XV13L]|nr:hypothetical protein [Lactobacillus sp. XV13L]
MSKKNVSKPPLIFLLGLLTLGVVLFMAFNSNEIKDKFDWLTLKQEQKLDVPLENQYPDLPNGCEVTALSMLLRYYDIRVTKLDLSQNIKHVSSFNPDGKYRGNPHAGFVGYMSQANAGWCVFNEPLEQVARKYTSRIQNATGRDFIQVLKLVSDGHPVMIITTTTFNHVNDMQTWKTAQGTVNVTPSSHACVITGFNKKTRTVYVNDPFGTKNKAVSWQNLERSYNQQGKQALYIN